MTVASRPCFVRDARSLLLLKLDGELGFGLKTRACTTSSGRSIFVASRVEPLSPAARAGISRGDELHSIQVLGVDRHAYAWSFTALERIDLFDEIWVVQIWVIKRNGHQLSQLQERRRERIQAKLARAKEILIEGSRSRGAFIHSQLEKAVVLIYDYELAHFGALWRATPEDDRAEIPIPRARAFLSPAQLPGLRGVVVDGPTTPTPSFTSTPAQSPRPAILEAPYDSEATESVLSTPRRRGVRDEDRDDTEDTETQGSRRHRFVTLDNAYAPTRPSLDAPDLQGRAKKKRRGDGDACSKQEPSPRD